MNRVPVFLISFGYQQGSTDELWALATHPLQNKFLAGSYDGIIIERETDTNTITWSRDFQVSFCIII